MTRKSFPHRPERATDLLGIIHSDVCGPLRHVSRQGPDTFHTFMDEIYVVYGYVYLLKHKHEVMKHSRCLKNGVENSTLKANKFLGSSEDQFRGDLELRERCVKQDTPDKLQQRSVKCIFIGYPKETMDYYFYFPSENKIVVARMDNSKCGHILMQERLDLNKTQGASTLEENPGEPHWTDVKTILKYLRNTKDMFLVYGGNPEVELRVDCYCDAGFETDRDDTKSQTGNVFNLE
ncbi:hypothetical protein Tco_0348588 [Tanacetum coccineum]